MSFSAFPLFRQFKPVTSQVTPPRLKELDGLRGWAALCVILFHLFIEMFGRLVPWFFNPATAFVLDGSLAVSVFFVLSGEALSTAYFAGGGKRAVAKLALKRYPRLTIPILATCMIVYLLLRFGLDFHFLAAPVVRRMDWLGDFLRLPLSLSYFIRYALFDVYLNVGSERAVDPFLWTMEFEGLGSLLVFALLLGFRRLAKPWFVILALAVVLFAIPDVRQLGCFLAGCFFAAARANGAFGAIHRMPSAGRWSALAFCGLAVLDGATHATGLLRDFYPLLAPPIVLALFCNKTMSDILASRLSQLLGKLSFPLYLVQFPVFIAFTSWCVNTAKAHGELDTSTILVVCLLSVVMCLGASLAFLPVESLTKQTGNRIVRLVLAAKRRC